MVAKIIFNKKTKLNVHSSSNKFAVNLMSRIRNAGPESVNGYADEWIYMFCDILKRLIILSVCYTEFCGRYYLRINVRNYMELQASLVVYKNLCLLEFETHYIKCDRAYLHLHGERFSCTKDPWAEIALYIICTIIILKNSNSIFVWIS